MSALQALNAARNAGVRVGIDGYALTLDADAAPPSAVVDLLTVHKPGVIALLRTGSDGWSGEDWRALFDERAAIVEFDGVAHIPLQVTSHHKRWFALVDVEDMERVAAIKWMGLKSGRTIYVRATSGKHLAKHHESLQNFIMRTQPGERINHENNNGLDNRKAQPGDLPCLPETIGQQKR